LFGPIVNFGYCLGPGHVGLDFDLYKPGGPEDRAKLGEIPPTFRVRTPSGGEHVVMSIRRAIGQQKPAHTIDVRTGIGYLVCPGSVVDGRPYQILEDLPPSPCPPHIDAFLGKRVEPGERSAAWVNGTCGDWRTRIPATVWERIRAEGEDRSKHCFMVLSDLFTHGLTDDDVLQVVTEPGAVFANKYLADDRDDFEAEICRVRTEWKRARSEDLAHFTEVAPFVPTPSPSRLVSRLASDIPMKRLEWLWPNRIPRGKCSVVAGEGKLGKSTMLAGIAATLSRHAPLPNGEGHAPRGSTIYFSAEDDPEDTVVPRLAAAGADRTKIRIVEATRREDDRGNRTFNLEADVSELEKLIVEIGDVVLVIFDPISSYFGKTDTYRNTEVRGVLEPLARLASRHRISIIGNTHLGKNEKAKANFRILDSVAITNFGRAVSLVVKDPADPERRLWIPTAGNLSRDAGGLAFRISEHVVDAGQQIAGTRVDWEPGEVTMTADEALAAGDKRSRQTPARDRAKVFLLEILANGSLPAAEFWEAAQAHGHSRDVIFGAAADLGIKPQKTGMTGGWVWELPPQAG
jgi:hypothetical protein